MYSILPDDQQLARDVLCAFVLAALDDTYPVRTEDGTLVRLSLKEIGHRLSLRGPLGRIKTSDGWTPGLNPSRDLDFAEIGVSSAEGSTVDVLSYIGTDVCTVTLIIRVHHGRNNACTFHLQKDTNKYLAVCDFNKPLSNATTIVCALYQQYWASHPKSVGPLAEDVRDMIETRLGLHTVRIPSHMGYQVLLDSVMEEARESENIKRYG